MNKNYKKILITTVLLLAILFSCSKARIEKPNEITDIPDNNETVTELIKFIPLDNYFYEKERKPEVFNYTFPYSPTQYYPKTTEGTSLASTTVAFTTITGDSIDYPYLISINEFYNIKDIIYANKQPIYKNALLSVCGVFNINISKDNQPLIINPNSYCTLLFYQKVSFEHNNDSIPVYKLINNNWSNTNDYFVVDANANLQIYGVLHSLNWLMFGVNAEFPSTTYTKLKFTSNKYDLTNVGIYIVFSNRNTFTRVKNQESIGLPVGEQAKLVAFAITNQGQLYSYYKDITIEENQNYDIKLHETTDNNLTILLDGL